MYLKASASRAVTLLAKNPPLFGRMVFAKVNATRPMPALPVRRRMRDVVFEYGFPGSRSTAPMYFGAYALLVVDAMRRYLHPGDTFFDVGANIGYLSAIGAGLVGSRGQVHCFEPVPTYFQRLCRLAELNPEYSIIANPCAAADAPGSRTLYVTREPGQNTLVSGYKNGPEVVSTIQVPAIRLDSYIDSYPVQRLSLIKIDAEGFELPILQGLQNYFERADCLPAVICEIAPRAYPLMGRKLRELSEFMSRYGHTARDIIDGTTPVDISALRHVDDVLFLAGS